MGLVPCKKKKKKKKKMKRKRLKSYLFWSYEDITRRWPFASQEEGSHKEPNLPAP